MISIKVPQPKYYSSITNAEYDTLTAAHDAEIWAECQDLQPFRTFVCTRRTMDHWHPENPDLINQQEAIISSALKMFPERIHECVIGGDSDRYHAQQGYRLMALINLKDRESAYVPVMEFIQIYYPMYWKHMKNVMTPPLVLCTFGLYASHTIDENGIDKYTWIPPLVDIDKLIDRYRKRVANVIGPYIT